MGWLRGPLFCVFIVGSRATEPVEAMSAENISRRSRLRRNHWLAWMGLCGALAFHVADEASTGFLDLYNPAVRELREKYPLLLLPTFTFEVWLGLLIFAIVMLIAASFFVWKGRWAMRPISHVFAVFMLTNGLLHIAVWLYMREWVSGVYSSPLLITASIVLIAHTCAYQRAKFNLD